MECLLTFTSLVLVAMVTGVQAQFDPLLNVESCTKNKLVVSTYGAAPSGMIYIQGQGDNCKHVTSEGTAIYEFDFQQCGIQWESLFKIVIQKNQEFQTGADKLIPIFCIADMDDLVVHNTKNADKLDDGSLNMTVKPSAFMTFYKVVSEEEVSGSEVKLTDTLIMSLQLDSQWKDDFDIKARHCVAADIVLIENYCASDPELFPNFSRFQPGYLMSQFGAFRTTSLEGGAVQMNFTCVLEICKEECTATNCDGATGWGRRRRATGSDTAGALRETTTTNLNTTTSGRNKKRHNMRRRQADNLDIDVGGKVKVVVQYSDIQVVDSETFCMSIAIFVIIIILLATGFLVTASSSMILYRKWSHAHVCAKELDRQRNMAVRKLSGVTVRSTRLADFY